MKKILVLIIVLSNIVFASDYKAKLLGNTKGDLIVKENIQEIHPFASLTKLMTAVLVIEEVDKGNFSYDNIVTVPKEALKYKGSTINLATGQKVKLNDLLYATLVHSANDAAYTMAHFVSKGNVEKFVDNMNKKAKEIGMLNTTYFTPHGLPTSMTGLDLDRGTAFDIYKLSLYAMKKPKLMEVVGTKSIKIIDGKRTIQNRNSLVGKVEGVTGLKTGYHDDSMYNISISFTKDKEDYVAVLFGGKNATIRDGEMTKTIKTFVPPQKKDVATYIKEDINLYKNKSLIYFGDEASVIINFLREGKELNNNAFDKVIVIE